MSIQILICVAVATLMFLFQEWRLHRANREKSLYKDMSIECYNRLDSLSKAVNLIADEPTNEKIKYHFDLYMERRKGRD